MHKGEEETRRGYMGRKGEGNKGEEEGCNKSILD
jgi:hypothetical protein